MFVMRPTVCTSVISNSSLPASSKLVSSSGSSTSTRRVCSSPYTRIQQLVLHFSPHFPPTLGSALKRATPCWLATSGRPFGARCCTGVSFSTQGETPFAWSAVFRFSGSTGMRASSPRVQHGR